MDILVTYDINTLTKPGRARLRRVAKICQGHGQRVQFSVFECSVNDTQLETLRHQLIQTLCPAEDSLRIYQLRGHRDAVVAAYGKDPYTDFHQPLIL